LIFKKFIGWLLILLGIACFILVGGGSMRYRNKSIIYSNSLSESFGTIALIILLPIIGFFLFRFGYKILKEFYED